MTYITYPFWRDLRLNLDTHGQPASYAGIEYPNKQFQIYPFDQIPNLRSEQVTISKKNNIIKNLKCTQRLNILKKWSFFLLLYLLVTIQYHKIYTFDLRNSWGQHKVNIRSKKVKFESLNIKMEQKCFLFCFSCWFQIWNWIFKICYIFVSNWNLKFNCIFKC